MSGFHYLFRYIIIGDPEVGKSCIMISYTDSSFKTFYTDYIPTIGVDFTRKFIELNNRTYQIQIWDTSGQERFRPIIKTYFQDTTCVLVVYDITNRKSFDNVTTWIEDYKNIMSSEKILIILVGNKSDLNDKRQVSTEEGQDLADKFGILFFEISAKTRENVDNIFEKSVEEIQKRMDENYYNLEKDKCGIKRGNK